jgi:DNA phosphorothioation-associated putative methyltransferase
MARSSMSAPIARAIADGEIKAGMSLLDLGCGRGGDVARLCDLGVSATGYDPHWRPDEAALVPCEIVSLLYVLNVVEDVAERAALLKRAWSLADRLLIVAVRLTSDNKLKTSTPRGDGVLTARGTFQRFYGREELCAWVKSELGVTPHDQGGGTLYLYKTQEEREDD